MKNRRRRNPNESNWAVFALVGQVGWTIAIATLLGVAAGHFVDTWLKTTPIATLIGLLLGLAAGIYGVYRLISSL